jgi:hypothetical protein
VASFDRGLDRYKLKAIPSIDAPKRGIGESSRPNFRANIDRTTNRKRNPHERAT